MNYLLFCLVAVSPALGYAGLPSGHYIVFDRYGLPPSPDPKDPKAGAYTEWLSHAQKGGHLKTSDADTFDLIFPNFYRQGIQRQVMPLFENYIYEPLMRADPRGLKRTLYPVVAKSVDVDASGAIFTIQLRDDVTFPDGSKVKAKDVISSWKVQLEDVNGPGLQKWFDRVYGNVRIRELSRFTVEVRFPDIPMTRQREALWNFLNSVFLVKPNPNPGPSIQISYPYLGTGPYLVESASRDAVKLVRRKDHWNSSAPFFNFDRIDITQYRDHTVEREAFRKGDLNYYRELVVQSEPVLDDGLKTSKYVKHLVPFIDENLRTMVLHMNTASPRLADVRVRKALALAMDLEAPNRLFYSGTLSWLDTPGEKSPLAPQGRPRPAVAALLKSDAFAEESDKPFEEMGLFPLSRISDQRERLKAAMRFLHEAGFEVVNGEQRKDGRPLEVNVLIWNQSRLLKTMAIFEENLKRLGIRLIYQTFPDTSAMIKIITSQTYDLFPQEIPITRSFDVLDADDMIVHFHSSYSGAKDPHSIQTNYSNLMSPTLDRLLEESANTDPASERYRDLVDATLRLLSAHVPYILLGERPTTTIYTDSRLCLAPNTTWLLEAAYFSDRGCAPH